MLRFKSVKIKQLKFLQKFVKYMKWKQCLRIHFLHNNLIAVIVILNF